MRKGCFIQSCPNSTNAAIHHIGWRDNIRAALGIIDGLFDQDIQGGIIINTPIADQTVMTMCGKWIKRNINNNAHVRFCRFNGGNRPTDQIVIG